MLLKYKKTFFALICLLLIFCASFALGVDFEDGDIQLRGGSGIITGGLSGFGGIVGRLSSYLVLIGSVLAPLMIIIAAYMYFTAAGDSSKAQSAKKLIYWAVGGFAFILVSRVLFSVISSVLQF